MALKRSETRKENGTVDDATRYFPRNRDFVLINVNTFVFTPIIKWFIPNRVF